MKTPRSWATRQAAGKSRATWAVTAPGESRMVLIAAVPPLMLKTATIRAACRCRYSTKIRAADPADRSQFFRDLRMPFYGYNRPDAKSPRECSIRSRSRGCSAVN